jgi:hypothetical protein
MPHASLKLIPGVDQNRTPALNEAAISESNLIRFVPDRNGTALPQKLGGWTKFLSQPLTATVRALHAWADTNSNSFLAMGAENGVFTSESAGSALNRSPQYYTANITPSFDTVSGSAIVKVNDAASFVTSYDAIFLVTPISVDGLILSGFYKTTAFNSGAYEITSTNILGAIVPATSTVTGGGTVPEFDTNSGDINVVVTLNNHGYAAGANFAVLIPTTVGGVTLYGNYIIQDTPAPTANTFVIAAPYAATSTASAFMNGGKAQIIYYTGQQAVPPPVGFGDGLYGLGDFGTGVSFTGGRQYVPSAITMVGTTATATIPANVYVTPGSVITIAGTTPSGYNGSWVVTSAVAGSVSSTLTFSLPSTLGPQTVAGTLKVNRWGFAGTTDWSLDNWGEYLVACPHMGSIFYWNTASGSDHCDIMPNAPLVNEGMFISMPERQVIAYGSTFNGIQDPLLVRWCDVGNFSSWVGTVTNQAGSYRIPKGSMIVGGLQGPQQSLLWTDIALWSMQYISQPFIYSFNEIGTGCGLVGRKAAATMSGVVYWMSQSQFFRLSGGGPEPIQCPIWDVIFQDIDTAYWQNVRCAPNSRFGEVSWYYPTTGSGGVPTKYVKYNTLTNQWDFGTLARTAWIDQSVFGPPIGAGDNLFIYQHETSTDADGVAMNSSFKTGYFALADGDEKTFLDQLWPDMKWGYYNGVPSADVSITFYTTDYPGLPPTVHGPYLVTQSSDYITPRIRARLIAIEISSNDVGSFWRLGNIRYRVQQDGKF